MHNSLALSTALVLSAAPLLAQAGPGTFTPLGNDPTFSKANFQTLNMYRTGATGMGIDQINFTKVPGVDGVGQWTVTLTVTDLSPTYGGSPNGSDWVVMGQYDTTGNAPVFKPNTQANAMNDINDGGQFSLMIEPRDGLFATVDRKSGMFISRRLAPNLAFPNPVMLTPQSGTPAPPGNYLDPAPGYVDGKLHVFYTESATEIHMRELFLTRNTAGNLSKAEMGPVKVIVKLSNRPHSPTPLIDRAGNVQGMLMAANSGSDSDIYFLPCLSINEAPILAYDDAGWQNNGGVCGGRIFFADYGANNETYARVSRAAWLMGSNTPIGGNATLTCGVSNPNRPLIPVPVTLAMSLSVNNGTIPGVPIPGWNGMYALAGNIFVFGSMAATDADELAHWQTAVPNNSALVGTRLTVQGLAAVTGEPATLTNTATLEIK